MVELMTLPADRPLEQIEMSKDDFISLFPSLVRELISDLDLAARPFRTTAAQEKAEAIRSTLSYWAEDPDVLTVVPYILGKLHQIDPEVTVEDFARFLVGDALTFVELEMGQADPRYGDPSLRFFAARELTDEVDGHIVPLGWDNPEFAPVLGWPDEADRNSAKPDERDIEQDR